MGPVQAIPPLLIITTFGEESGEPDAWARRVFAKFQTAVAARGTSQPHSGCHSHYGMILNGSQMYTLQYDGTWIAHTLMEKS